MPEVVAALIILALVSSSVLVVINRCMSSVADSSLRMQAFEAARENMEKLLASDTVKESIEFGSSDKYPGIQWQTVVETFYEPLTARMWIQAICSAEYTDTKDEVQTVKLTHWLTDLTKEQLLAIMGEKEKAFSPEQTIETVEEAAEYAGVDVSTIQQWIENGMPQTEDGNYVKSELDLYQRTDGRPTIEDRKQQAKLDEGLREAEDEQGEQDEREPVEKSDEKTLCGYTMSELNQMDFAQLWEILLNCDEF